MKLFTSRCNPAFRDFEGKNSLLIAAERGHVDIVHELLRIGEKEKKQEKKERGKRRRKRRRKRGRRGGREEAREEEREEGREEEEGKEKK